MKKEKNQLHRLVNNFRRPLKHGIPDSVKGKVLFGTSMTNDSSHTKLMKLKNGLSFTQRFNVQSPRKSDTKLSMGLSKTHYHSQSQDKKRVKLGLITSNQQRKHIIVSNYTP